MIKIVAVIHLESSKINKHDEEENPEDVSLGKVAPRRSDRKKSRSRSRKDLKEISSHPNGDRHSSDEEDQSVSVFIIFSSNILTR
ncbi:5159_t:CDS:2 [Funneliformis mosseae]|uniref:5159_t:CDS:1 n=1 Tax=Funneliformis mosseae TaxID=27381 RepID=A0A9N8VR89_FUNMO|nr:5159_t:CDS:2 [Funneliformis mosseae]